VVCPVSMVDVDMLAMAETGLLAAVVGEWEIIHEFSSTPWGSAVVKSLKDAVILADRVTPCSFSYQRCCREDVSASVVTITWGEASYATLEKCEQNSLTWRLPPLEGGTQGAFTTWRRRHAKASMEVFSEEVVALHKKAAEALAAVRTKAAAELKDAQANAARELALATAKAAEDLEHARAEAAAELEKVQDKAALSDQLADARARVADEIAEENFLLREQLNSMVVRCDALQYQEQSVRMLVKKLLRDARGSSLLEEDMSIESMLEDFDLESGAEELTPKPSQEVTDLDEELPKEKRPRTEVSGISTDKSVWGLAACGV